MSRLAPVVLTIVLGTGIATPARADRREASLHAHLVGGVLGTGDVDGGRARELVGLAGLAVRAGYATRDTFQYDVALAFLRSGAAAFPSHRFTPAGAPPAIGPYSFATTISRVDAGVTFRLGVRWIPTARLAAGLQLRRAGAVTVDAVPVIADARAPRLDLDLIGTASIGLDHRLDRRWIVGVAAGGSLAVPLGGTTTHTAEITLHAACYWYPRW